MWSNWKPLTVAALMVLAIVGASYCSTNGCHAGVLHDWFFGDAGKTMNVLTFILVLIAIWQIAAARSAGKQQAQDTIEALKISRDSADAATKSAHASVEAQRARFQIVLTNHNFAEFAPNAGLEPNGGDATPIFGTEALYAFTNYGKSPAVIFEISHGLVLAPELPDALLYDHREHILQRLVIEARDTTESVYFRGDVLTLGQVRLLAGGATFIWFYAQIGYRDVFGVDHFDCFKYRYPGINGTTHAFLYEFGHQTTSGRTTRLV